MKWRHLVLIFGAMAYLSGSWYLVDDIMNREGKHWSERQLIECQIDDACDEQAALEEHRLYEATSGTFLPFLAGLAVFFLSCLAAFAWPRSRPQRNLEAH